METKTEKTLTPSLILDPELVRKVMEDTEQNDLAKFVGFMNLIEESFKMLFTEIGSLNTPKSKVSNSSIWSDQVVELRFEASDFNREQTVFEITNKIMQNTLKYKIPVVKVLEKLQGETFKYKYKSKGKPGKFELELQFNFEPLREDYYPVSIGLKFKNIPDDEKIRKDLAVSIWYQLVTDLKEAKNIPATLLSRKVKFKASGHYIDQKLKHKSDKSKQGQLNIFDIINPQLRNKIKDEVIVEGIKISPSEDKLLNAILKLLHFKSNHMGNMPAERKPYGGQITDYPVLKFTPTELYKEFTNKGDYSGKEIQNIKEIFKDLQDRKFLIIYKRHRKDEKGNEVIDRIEEYQPLLKVITYYEGLTEEEDISLDSGKNINSEKGEIILMLNPIFVDQIDTKFIEFPTDINKLTSIAAGGAKKVTESLVLLRDYLMREISSRRSKTVIDINKLHYIIGLEKYILQKRKKLVEQRTNEAIEAITNLGIVKNTEYITGSKGQEQIVFNLNTDF